MISERQLPNLADVVVLDIKAREAHGGEKWVPIDREQRARRRK
jgi:hypothetical protein